MLIWEMGNLEGISHKLEELLNFTLLVIKKFKLRGLNVSFR